MSKDGYLPPGVESGDLPGNTPEDEEWDKLFEWFPADLTPADIKDRVTHAPAIQDLIVIYERDRTKHLRSIEGADKDLAELGESLGEEIEALKAELAEWEEHRPGLCEAIETVESAIAKAEAQRDELLKAAEEVVEIVDGITVLGVRLKPSPKLVALRAAIAKATP